MTIRRVTLGASLRTVGEKAFYKCTGLQSVTFGEKLQAI
ncbi:MAG TPA: hypothetical protein DDW30_03740, partial [Clostridiales bacterium]|nr:hypothetical protein [Clostridiales bacterium]